MSLFGGDSPRSSRQSTSIYAISDDDDISEPEGRSDQREPDAQLQNHDNSDHELDALGGDSDSEDAATWVTEADHASRTARLRFQGSDRTWKQYTKDETALANSLDILRAEDLAAHLFNAHSWKRSISQRERSDSDADGPGTYRMAGAAEQGTGTWMPSTKWTAWPLEPQLVPHPDQRFLSPRRSASGPAIAHRLLREQLIATSIRCASVKWQTRAVDTTVSASTQQQTHNAAGFTTDGPQPTLCADDDSNEAIIGPEVESLMSRIDNLLLALHHNRSGQFAYSLDADAIALRNASRRNSKSRSASRQREWRRRSRAGSVTAEKRQQDIDDVNDGDRVSRSRKRQRTMTPESSRYERSRSAASSSSDGKSSELRPRIRRPRDWSEVLGFAAMIGWDSKAVQNASARCSNLFGVSMAWKFDLPGETDIRNADEDSAADMTRIALAHERRHKGAKASSKSAEDATDDFVVGGAHNDGFMLPV